jgi:hypothetical protein
MSYLDRLVFVDCEARGPSPINGTLTEFGAVHFSTRQTFYGQLFESTPDPQNPAIPLVGKRLRDARTVGLSLVMWLQLTLPKDVRPVFVSDNPAFDFMWIACMFDEGALGNPFGHSGRRISDFYAGLLGKFERTQGWKRLRQTVHDHNPVNDAMGNVEAFARLLEGER